MLSLPCHVFCDTSPSLRVLRKHQDAPHSLTGHVLHFSAHNARGSSCSTAEFFR